MIKAGRVPAFRWLLIVATAEDRRAVVGVGVTSPCGIASGIAPQIHHVMRSRRTGKGVAAVAPRIEEGVLLGKVASCHPSVRRACRQIVSGPAQGFEAPGKQIRKRAFVITGVASAGAVVANGCPIIGIFLARSARPHAPTPFASGFLDALFEILERRHHLVPFGRRKRGSG